MKYSTDYKTHRTLKMRIQAAYIRESYGQPLNHDERTILVADIRDDSPANTEGMTDLAVYKKYVTKTIHD